MTAGTAHAHAHAHAHASGFDDVSRVATGEIHVTQQLLEPLLGGRPRLTDKLLGRPPFRFIHDVVTSLTAATGFGEGLFTPAQLDPTKVTNKATKVEYLGLLIKCLSIHLGVQIEARPQKIAAGQEADLTNKLLQLLAVAATSGDSSYAVSRVLAGADAFDSTKGQS
jgi:TRAF3-interacting protein 1